MANQYRLDSLDIISYSLIAEYLGEYHTLKTLDRLCTSTRGLVKNRDLINFIMQGDADTIEELICIHGLYDMVVALISNRPSYNNKLMSLAGRYGHIKIIKFFVTTRTEEYHLRNCFHSACMGNHLDICMFLYDRFKTLKAANEIIAVGFKYACFHQSLSVVKWLLETGYFINSHENTVIFEECCKKKYFDAIKLVCNPNDLQYSMVQKISNNAVLANDYHLVKFLLDYIDGDILWVYFYAACQHSDLKIAKMMQTYINQPGIIPPVFVRLCIGGYIDAVSWLYKLYGENIDVTEAFKQTIQTEHLKILDFLMATKKVDIESHGKEYIETCVKLKNILVYQWLRDNGVSISALDV